MWSLRDATNVWVRIEHLPVQVWFPRCWASLAQLFCCQEGLHRMRTRSFPRTGSWSGAARDLEDGRAATVWYHAVVLLGSNHSCPGESGCAHPLNPAIALNVPHHVVCRLLTSLWQKGLRGHRQTRHPCPDNRCMPRTLADCSAQGHPSPGNPRATRRAGRAKRAAGCTQPPARD
eukprot:scaffold223661_cov33-Tisochrysis_lutea.AAC.1